MEFDKVIRERTATRKFQNKIVEKEKLEKILEAGRIAPTAKNIQPQVIYVLQSKEAIEKIEEASPCIYQSKTVLLICSNKEIAYHTEEDSTYEMDACIVATHMMLAATNLGVDNVWIKRFDKDIVRKNFNIPEKLEPICLMPLGYRTSDCPENPNHHIRKSLEDMIIYQ
ncbi:MAG: nitroreductase family protein [Bacilli bacterium]|nr:nitroreductase family protein [Bacilli bacterium]